MKVNLPVQLRAATMDPATANEEDRTIEVCWSTGASVRRGGFFTDPYNEELDMAPKCVRMDRLSSGRAPVLNAHGSYDLSQQIGVVKSASLASGEGRAMLRFSKRDEVTPFWRDIKDGIICNVSVGYRVYKAVKTETADGQIPTVRIVDWEPMEISMVPIGADPGAGSRADEPTISCELENSQEQPVSGPGPAVSLLRLALEIEGEAI